MLSSRLITNGQRANPAQPVAIVANGGYGKSRLAIEFSAAHSDLLRRPYLVRANSESILRQQIASIANTVMQGAGLH